MVPYYSTTDYSETQAASDGTWAVIITTTGTTTSGSCWGSPRVPVWRDEAVDNFIKSRDALFALWAILRAAQFKSVNYLGKPLVAKTCAYGSAERHLEHIRRRHQRL